MAAEITENESSAVSILGIRFSNPVLVASGSFSDSLPQIRRVLTAGAGGVVTKTIYCGDKLNVVERVHKGSNGVFNSTTYSRVSLERWLRTLTTLAEEKAPVVVSIYAQSPKQLGELAYRIVQTGSRALELCLCCPNDTNQSSTDWRLIGRYVSEVRNAVNVPFSVKLSAAGSLIEDVKAALGEGADAISLSDALPSLLVDFENRSLVFGGPVAYSGPPIKPIVLHSIFELRQSGISCPIFGIGGIGSAADVLEYLQVGANAAQVYTMLITDGVDSLSKITRELLAWCAKERVTVRELVGAALPRVAA
jgi:dihydroorotate dehydrogenase subfamily 1